MNALKADLILFALIVSAALHFGVMYYMRPMVMTHVASESRTHARRGPMKVTYAKAPSEPVKLETVADVKPTKEAPEAESVATSAVPAADTSLPPTAETVSTEVPSVTPPVFADPAALKDVLPEIRTSSLSPVAEPAFRMSLAADAPKPSAAVSRLPVAPAGKTESMPLPSVDLAVPALASVAAAEPAPSLVAREDPKEKPKEPAFVPPPEVMEKVDEKVVTAEKEAVRNLVNSTEASDLRKSVEMQLAGFATPTGTYFRVTVAPKASLPLVPKDVVILIDASGSIGRERMGSIRGAAKRLLRSAANTGDRFNLVAFRDRYSYAFRTWQECTESSFAAADKWLANVAPFGRTDVFATITSVLTLPRSPARPLIALVITDGEANTGISDTEDILSKFTTLNDGLVSVYMYGVKASANRPLIDVLTRGNRGEGFVFTDPGWFARARAGEGLEGLSRRFRDPVLSDLRVVFASDCPADAYPRLLRNLYRGNTVEIVGRLPKGAREVAFSLKGLNAREAYEGYFRMPLSGASSDATLPAAWASERQVERRASPVGRN